MLSHGDGVITLDFDNENGQTVKSIIYDKELTTITNKKVMNDIDNYFRGGRQSELMQFHTSYSKKIAYSTFADEIKDWGGFNSALMNIVHRNYPKHLAQNGDIIVPIGNQLIYTDGNTENPGVSKVITFDTEYADEISEATEVIYDFEERESQVQNAYKIIERAYGKEFVSEYTNGAYSTIRRFDRRAERGKSKSDTYHRNFMQDRIRNAQEIIRNANSPSKSTRLEADGYSEVVPGKLGFTDERIDELLSGGWYGSTNKDYAQAYITYMSPMDFLKLTTGKNQRALERINVRKQRKFVCITSSNSSTASSFIGAGYNRQCIECIHISYKRSNIRNKCICVSYCSGRK